MNEYKLTSKHIQLYADHLRLEEKGAATIEKYLRDVRAFGFWLDGREISKGQSASGPADGGHLRHRHPGQRGKIPHRGGSPGGPGGDLTKGQDPYHPHPRKTVP